MTVQRRSILKGMLAGSALAAFGIPKLSFAATKRTETRELVLVGSGDGFASGVRSVVDAPVVELGSVLPDVAATRRLFETQQGKRLVGLMSSAAYALFSELARDAGASQVFEGRHAIADDGASRHALNSVAGFHGSAEALAAGLAASGAAFAISEVPLGAATARGLRGGDWGPHGFKSFHVAADCQPLWLHLAGLDLAQGCSALGVDAELAEPLRRWRTYAPQAVDASGGWDHAVGQILASLAVGGVENKTPCVAQIFVHGSRMLEELSARDSLVSFVMET